MKPNFLWFMRISRCSLPWLACAALAGESVDNLKTSRALIDDFAAGRFEEAAAFFSDDLKDALPAGRLGEVWGQIQDQSGHFVSSGEPRAGAASCVLVPVKFEKAELEARVCWTPDGRIGGLHFAPALPSYVLPDYADPAAFTEKDLPTGSKDWPLPGTLAMPVGKGPFPAVVLVHGSGPNDRDESVGALKPFKDIAVGLAGRGVAVYRYDKRTVVHGGRLKASSITIDEETIEDAVLALETLRRQPGIDPKRVYLVGHSLGAAAAPEIALRDGKTAGVILLAPSGKPLVEKILEQSERIARLDGQVDEAESKAIEEVRAFLKGMKDGTLGPEARLLGMPAAYLADIEARRLPEKAAELIVPVLVLRGERDYQVTAEDIAAWQKVLEGRAGARFKTYPKLNHLFAPGEGPGNPDEYSAPGHVSSEVIADLVHWIAEGRL